MKWNMKIDFAFYEAHDNSQGTIKHYQDGSHYTNLYYNKVTNLQQCRTPQSCRIIKVSAGFKCLSEILYPFILLSFLFRKENQFFLFHCTDIENKRSQSLHNIWCPVKAHNIEKM